MLPRKPTCVVHGWSALTHRKVHAPLEVVAVAVTLTSLMPMNVQADGTTFPFTGLSLVWLTGFQLANLIILQTSAPRVCMEEYADTQPPHEV